MTSLLAPCHPLVLKLGISKPSNWFLLLLPPPSPSCLQTANKPSGGGGQQWAMELGVTHRESLEG